MISVDINLRLQEDFKISPTSILTIAGGWTTHLTGLQKKEVMVFTIAGGWITHLTGMKKKEEENKVVLAHMIGPINETWLQEKEEDNNKITRRMMLVSINEVFFVNREEE